MYMRIHLKVLHTCIRWSTVHVSCEISISQPLKNIHCITDYPQLHVCNTHAQPDNNPTRVTLYKAKYTCILINRYTYMNSQHDFVNHSAGFRCCQFRLVLCVKCAVSLHNVNDELGIILLMVHNGVPL